jgi:hypothetical protein
MIRQRVYADLKRAVEAGKTLGRPRAAVEKRIQTQLRAGKGIIKVVSVGTGTVQRIAQGKAENEGGGSGPL